mmetsp:Transcript_14574/g.36634  ORF Transcript_14574/g.36634 Transcript_14574/m.36634 type:complete len:208 (+) Transcript_14574:300-923(+)
MIHCCLHMIRHCCLQNIDQTLVLLLNPEVFQCLWKVEQKAHWVPLANPEGADCPHKDFLLSHPEVLYFLRKVDPKVHLILLPDREKLDFLHEHFLLPQPQLLYSLRKVVSLPAFSGIPLWKFCQRVSREALRRRRHLRFRHEPTWDSASTIRKYILTSPFRAFARLVSFVPFVSQDPSSPKDFSRLLSWRYSRIAEFLLSCIVCAEP